MSVNIWDKVNQKLVPVADKVVTTIKENSRAYEASLSTDGVIGVVGNATKIEEEEE